MKALALLLFLTVLPATASAHTDPRAGAVIGHMREALGSTVPIASSVHLHGTLQQLGFNGSEDLYILPSHKAMLEVDEAGAASGKSGYTGTTAWSADNYGIVRVETFPAQRAQYLNQAYFATNAIFNPARWPADITFAGEKSVNGIKADVLHIMPQGSSPFDMYVSTATWLPVRLAQPAGFGVSVTDLRAYKTIGGVRVPTVQIMSGGGNSTTFRVTSVKLNDPAAQAALTVPKSTAHDFSIAGSGVASVPFDLVENHVYVHVKMNGKGPYTFIFDTGGLNVITPEVAQQLSAAQQGGAKVSGVGAKAEQMRFTKVDTLDIGDARLRNQNFIVLDIARGFGVSAGMHVDGLIGYEVLSRFITTFDYGAHKLTFAMPGANVHLKSPIDFAFDGTIPHIRASVDGVTGWFTVDTGNRTSLVLDTPFLSAHPSLKPPANSPSGAIGFGIGGAPMGQIGRVRSLRIGKFAIADPITDFASSQAGGFASTIHAGNIGGGIWKRFAVTFDYPNERMGLVPNANYAKPDTGDRSGLFLINNNGAITVYDVLTHTPAAALGLRKGDVITQVNGTTPRSLQQIRKVLQGAPGTKITLTIERGVAAPTTQTLTLATYV